MSPRPLNARTFSGRRKVSQEATKGQEQHHFGYDGEEDTANRLGQFYMKVFNFNVITRNAVYILPVAALLAIPLAIFATTASESRAGGIRLCGLFIWLEIVWASLWVAKLVARILPYIFTFLCGIVSSGTRKYRLVLVALETPLSLFLWSIASWATTSVIQVFDQGKEQPDWINILGRVLIASIAVTGVFLVQKVIVQLIGINYHRKQFQARISANKFKTMMLDQLYESSRSLFPAYCPEFLDEDYVILTGVESSNPSNSRLLGGLGRVGEDVTNVFGNMTSEIVGAQGSNPTSAHSVVVKALEMKTSTEALARRLWMSFVAEGKDALYQEDIIQILGSHRTEEAEHIFSTLDADCNGDVSLDEMIMTVVEVARERKALARSMHDVTQAVRVLDRFLSVIVVVCVAMIYAAFFSSGFAKYLATIGTQIAAISFALAGTAQEFLGSCIFLFVKHPYDVGDRVDIDKTPMIVEHVSLLYTVFRRVDNNKTVQIPNIVSNNMWIENVSRSKAMKEQISMTINSSTSFDDIELLRKELQTFLTSHDNKRDFMPTLELDILSVGDMKQLELRVEVTHKSNWSNEMLRATRRNKLMCALIASLRAVPIYSPGCGGPLAGEPANPSYSVSISREEAEAARAKFDAEKAAKRLVAHAPKVADAVPQAVSSAVDVNSYLRPADVSATSSGRPSADLGRDPEHKNKLGLRRTDVSRDASVAPQRPSSTYARYAASTASQ
ncbi:Mechanosensitive ion channel-domain-containing protein [Cryomyces antarcticus]